MAKKKAPKMPIYKTKAIKFKKSKFKLPKLPKFKVSRVRI